jgi:hypothetical protein
MADVPMTKFLTIYGNLLVQCWGNPALKKRFHDDPASVLKEHGLDPEGARVTIKKPDYSAAKAPPDAMVRLWNEGKKKGNIELYFPDQPPDEASGLELSETELMTVAGGWATKCCCCSCCPGSTAG